MKTILIPVDFSKSADNALDYAIEIAKCTSAKLFLFHAYLPPAAIGGVPVILSVKEIEKQIVRNLKKAERYIHSKTDQNLVVEYAYRCGSPVEEIKLCAERNKADLIIMGLHGAGFLKENLIGSVSTALINNSFCPVLIVNQNVKFRNLKNIALAFDYTEIKNKSILSLLNEFTNLFKSHIFIFNVVKSQLQAVSSISKAVDGMKLAHALQDAEHSFHYSENEDIVEGINQFVIDKKIDMVVMIPHKHSPLHALFNESQTKKMAFHTRIPILTLSESRLS
jgi:nucleotide-binding universal stress UspA family protein